MGFTNLGKKAKASILLEAKRQRAKNTSFFREDNRKIEIGTSLKSLYMQMNRELFSGQLPDIEVCYNNRLRRALGKAYFRIDAGGILVPTRIELRTNHRWTDRFKRKVMAHEMCHIWAYQFHNEDGHGKKFWQMMKDIGYPKFHDFEDSEPWERDVYC